MCEPKHWKVKLKQTKCGQIADWKVLLVEAGREESFFMDVPLLANMFQFTDANWKYKSVSSNSYCLGQYHKAGTRLKTISNLKDLQINDDSSSSFMWIIFKKALRPEIEEIWKSTRL